MFGEGLLAIEAQIEILPDRPVVLRLEREFAVADPSPLAGKFGLQFDACTRLLADQGQRGDRTRKRNRERMHDDRRDGVTGQLRYLHMETGGGFLDRMRTVLIPAITDPTAGCEHNQHGKRRR